MISFILLIAGIVAVIVSANTSIVIAGWIIWLLFGLAALILLAQIIQYMSVKRKVSKQFKNFRF